ncbi:integral membrane protein [Botrytis cinerea]
MKLFNFFSFLASIISIVPTAYSLATYSATSGGPSYSVGISSSNSNNVYFQLTAPTSYQWVALGIGSQMSGSTIFVMYSDGTGNVTLSPRKGTGQVEPKYDSSITVELLSGSGIVDGNMVANVLCTSCSSKLSSTTSTSSNWIAAWNSGSALDTTDTSTSIRQHSGSNHKSFTFDLSQAQLESDSNPFTSTSAATTSSSVLLFPLGALSMRVFGRPWLHAILQILSFSFLVVGLGLGIKLAGLKYGSFGESTTLAKRIVIDEIAKRQFGSFGSSTFTGTPPWATATGTYTGAVTGAAVTPSLGKTPEPVPTALRIDSEADTCIFIAVESPKSDFCIDTPSHGERTHSCPSGK